MKFKHKCSNLIGWFSFGVYQKPQRIEFSIILDWSEYPILEISFLFWSFEISMYPDKIAREEMLDWEERLKDMKENPF